LNLSEQVGDLLFTARFMTFPNYEETHLRAASVSLFNDVGSTMETRWRTRQKLPSAAGIVA